MPATTAGRLDPEVHEALVRRQRADALHSLRATPHDMFRPRWSRTPALTTLVTGLAIVALVGLPNPQDAIIARDARIRDAAAQQAQTIDKAADKLAAKSQDPNDPRTRLAKDLRDLAQQLRDRPDQLDANLARLGSIEDDLQASIDPSTEQRASALTSLSRSLSQATTGKQDANPTGDPKQAQKDLADASAKLDAMTPQERQDLAAKLAALQQTADATDGAAGAALRDAAQSLATGDIASAKEALDRLAKALDAAKNKIDVNRDLASAASQLQDSRHQLADAGRPGRPARPGRLARAAKRMPAARRSPVAARAPVPVPRATREPAKAGVRDPARRAAPGTGQRARGRGRGGEQGPGHRPGPGSGPGARPGAGPGPGPGPGPRARVRGQGSIGGGGSNARYLGQGTGGQSGFAGPTNGNKPSQLGPDLSGIYAPFDRLGKPGDPSYVAGTGGDGQTQQGTQTGAGTDNGSIVPYQSVYGTFHDYALTTLDRSYVPLSVKDYVRDYFTSLDPTH